MPPSKEIRDQPSLAVRLGRSRWGADGIALAVIAGVALLLASYSPNLHDPDSLYHLRHAAIYRAAGIGYAEFPWAHFSVVRTIGADLWYGFHLLLIPLTVFADPVAGVRAGDALTAILSLALAYAALRRLQVRWPLFWTLVFVFLTGDVVYRLPVLRPHPISLTLVLLLYTFLVEPLASPSSAAGTTGASSRLLKNTSETLRQAQGERKRVGNTGRGTAHAEPVEARGGVSQQRARARLSRERRRDTPASPAASALILRAAPVFVIGAVTAWIHILLSWVPILVLLIVEAFRFLWTRRVDFGKALGLVAGVLTGWVLRPNPVGAARLAYQVLVRMPIEKLKGVPMNIGTELTPFGWEDFTEQLIPLTFLLAVGIGLLLWLSASRSKQPLARGEEAAAWSSACIALIFGVMAFTVARRSNEFLVGFGVLFMAQVCTLFARQPAALRRQFARQWPARIAAALSVASLAYAPIQSWRAYDYDMKVSVPPDELKEAALWLKNHTEKGAIVFNVHWDRFGNLFGWNDHNHYINGMDPIFEYAFDPSLYWKHYFYAVGEGAAFTCGAQQCTSARSVPTHPVLARDFGASYVVVERRRSPKLFAHLASAPGFQNVFATPREAVFKILR